MQGVWWGRRQPTWPGRAAAAVALHDLGGSGGGDSKGEESRGTTHDGCAAAAGPALQGGRQPLLPRGALPPCREPLPLGPAAGEGPGPQDALPAPGVWGREGPCDPRAGESPPQDAERLLQQPGRVPPPHAACELSARARLQREGLGEAAGERQGLVPGRRGLLPPARLRRRTALPPASPQQVAQRRQREALSAADGISARHLPPKGKAALLRDVWLEAPAGATPGQGRASRLLLSCL